MSPIVRSLAIPLAITCFGLCAVAGARAADEIVAPGARLKAESLVAFTEGPAYHADGSVYFSDVANNRIMRRDAKGQTRVYRQPSGRANGLAFDAQGRLVACEGADEGGNRRITRTELDGTLTVLADRYQGNRFNSPNDLALDSQGRVYFTDPRYGPMDDLEQFDAAGKPLEAVYRIDPNGQVERLTAGEVSRPNGIAVSADGKTLFVVDNNTSSPEGNRKLWRFALMADGRLEPKSQKLLHDFGRGRGGDGMALDSQGRLYVAAGLNYANPPVESGDVAAGVYVFSADGKHEGFIPVPLDMVTNCTFGGPELKTLFITAGHQLLSVPVTVPGYALWPPPRQASR